MAIKNKIEPYEKKGFIQMFSWIYLFFYFFLRLNFFLKKERKESKKEYIW